jgi:aminoglycoside 6'-N-acetyltransferase I
MDFVTRLISDTDFPAWLQMRQTLWPDCPAAIHEHEMRQLREPEGEVFVAAAGEELVGFVEVSIRTFAEGCHGGRVGYVEGWYVAEAVRGRGVGRALLEAAEAWARERGCTEMASDTEPENATSRAAHARAGYAEVGTCVHFRKAL